MEIFGITLSISVMVIIVVALFIIIILSEGLSGGAVITSGLSELGCGCMFGGIIVLIVLTVLVSYTSFELF